MRVYAPGIEIESEDREVLACLAFHNRLPAMLAADRLEDQSGRQFPRSFTTWRAGDWVYIVVHCRGYEAAQDNGYAMMAVDLRVHSKEQAARILTAWCNSGRDQSGPWALEYVDAAPVSAN